VLASPVLGTRERLCSHHPCWEPENGHARSTHAGDQRAGWASVTDSARHPHSGPGRWKSGSLGVPGRARSAFCDRPELRHGRT
jgi:hypothetical protein